MNRVDTGTTHRMGSPSMDRLRTATIVRPRGRHGLAVALLALAAAGCGGGHDRPAAEGAPPLDVRTAAVEARRVNEVFEAGGIVQAQTTATLAARIMAPVREVRVQPGDKVRRGQVLVVLDDRDLSAGARQARTARDAANEGAGAAEAEIEGARAQLALAKASHDRIASLRSRNSATPHEMDEAVAALRGAEARVASAEARLRQARASQQSAGAASEAAGVAASFAAITAPFDGLVTEKHVEPGNLVAPGTPLVRVEDTRGFRLDVRVDESRAGHIRVGDTVPVVLDQRGDGPSEVRATVKEVARAVDSDARALLVKLALPEVSEVRSGMFGRARLPGEARPAVLAPASAVVRRGQVATVFVADGNKARLRLVHLGATSGDHVEVVSGLSEGEQVVIEPPAGLADGRAVRVSARAAGTGESR